MLTDRPEASVYLACAHTDMRKSINGLVVNPLAYLQYVFEQLPNVNLEDPLVIDRYLPWSESLPKQPQRREK